MFEIVPSQWMKKCFEEIGFAFTDFQKATLIWNASGRLRQEILDALEELSEETKDETLRRQINERLNYEKGHLKHLSIISPENMSMLSKIWNMRMVDFFLIITEL